mgnify:CR=1 FL=1
MAPTTTTRKSAGERREDVLEAARGVFAEHGLSGASTDEIARMAHEQGMTGLKDDGWAKVARGLTSVEEILRVVA